MHLLWVAFFLLVFINAKTSRGELVIAVVEKNGFSEFLKFQKNKETNETEITGSYLEVFDSIMKNLPNNIRYKLEPVTLHYPYTYDDLLRNVSLQKHYHGAFGDISVTANRSNYVEFTVPFGEGGVGCIVPMKPEQKFRALLAFLDPLSAELWVLILVFYMVTSVIFWVLSRGIVGRLPDFQGQHIGLICYFPFFPGNGIEANLLSVILVVWALVASLMWAIYTASLSSTLTAAKLVPTVTSVEQLIKNGGLIGYQEASFLPGYLKNIGFHESKMKNFSSPDQIVKALTHDFTGYCDVMPHINYMLSKGCGKYTLVSPIYHTVGFAIAFPKGFYATGNISRSILELIDKGKIHEIGKNMFSKLECVRSNSRSESFLPLSVPFATSGVATLACTVILLFYDPITRRSLFEKISISKDYVLSRVSVFWNFFKQEDMPPRNLTNNLTELKQISERPAG